MEMKRASRTANVPANATKVSGPCDRGYYCDEGSTIANRSKCAEDQFCAEGTTQPLACPADRALTCSSSESTSCADGSACLYDRCTGLNATVYCDDDKFQFELCASYFSAGFRNEGDVGCPKDSGCATFHKLSKTVDRLYTLNRIDTIVEIFATFVALLALFPFFDPNAIKLMNYLNLYVLMVVDLIIQAAVLTVAYEQDFENVAESIVVAGCWDFSYAFVTVDGLVNDISFIQVLGWFEFFLGIGSAVSARYEIGKGEEDRIPGILFLSIVMLLLDAAISVVDFFIFTIGAKEDFDDLTESVFAEAGVVDKFSSCVKFDRAYDPIPIQADDNCLEMPLPEEVYPRHMYVLISFACVYLLIRALLKFTPLRAVLTGVEEGLLMPASPKVSEVGLELKRRGSIFI
ncbi:hypothetical protein TrST_g7914 [Triparma strigata]|uniref:Uncharacterized protein n=1 Tax=Triparma strigata TaxID=1606541 RepID=A0A9W7EJ13_9STRA|nr:hypothetical protein TrST_g7914 [Triparma strigata]